MQQPELKGCPFCGESAAVTEVTSTFVRIECFDEACPIAPETDWMGSRAEAIAAWNKRVPDPLVQQMAQALETVKGILPEHNPQHPDMWGYAVCPSDHPDCCGHCEILHQVDAALKAWQESQQ